MSTTEERLNDNVKRDELINECCGNNESAKEYIYLLCAALRVWDDVYDEDYPVTKDDITNTYKILFISLPSNKFFKENHDLLFGQHLVLYNQWIASNRWLNGNKLEQMYAHFYKEGFNEIAPLVAFLTQGQAKMEEVSLKLRESFKSEIGG
jgi:hypothetical protein